MRAFKRRKEREKAKHLEKLLREFPANRAYPPGWEERVLAWSSRALSEAQSEVIEEIELDLPDQDPASEEVETITYTLRRMSGETLREWVKLRLACGEYAAEMQQAGEAGDPEAVRRMAVELMAGGIVLTSMAFGHDDIAEAARLTEADRRAVVEAQGRLNDDEAASFMVDYHEATINRILGIVKVETSTEEV